MKDVSRSGESTKTFKFFFFNDTATTEIYTLSLHDALPISQSRRLKARDVLVRRAPFPTELANVAAEESMQLDRKSTRLNSSHSQISYAVFCLKKKTESQ